MSPARGPRSPGHLAWVCNRLALQGFGGILAVAHHELVEREAWLTESEFMNLLAAAQVLPGPNIVNLCLMLGQRHFGWRGGVAVLAGMFLVPGTLVIGLTALTLSHLHRPEVANALRGMGLAAGGLLLGTCWKLVKPLRQSPLGPKLALGLAALSLGLSALAKWPLVWVILTVGGMGMARAWRRLRQPDEAP